MSEEKLNLARLKKHGNNFEISIDPDLALDFKKGEEVDIRDVLRVEQIFSDAKKGFVASKEELEIAFETIDVLKIAEIIIKSGEVQRSSEHRSQEKEERRKKLVNLIHKLSINPLTNTPHPHERIEAALKDAKVNLNDHKSIEEQLPGILSKLKSAMPIRVEQKIFRIIVRPAHIGQMNNFVRKNSKILKEEWNLDGSWKIKVEVPAGVAQEFIDGLNKITHGDIDIEND